MEMLHLSYFNFTSWYRYSPHIFVPYWSERKRGHIHSVSFFPIIFRVRTRSKHNVWQLHFVLMLVWRLLFTGHLGSCQGTNVTSPVVWSTLPKFLFTETQGQKKGGRSSGFPCRNTSSMSTERRGLCQLRSPLWHDLHHLMRKGHSWRSL